MGMCPPTHHGDTEVVGLTTLPPQSFEGSKIRNLITLVKQPDECG